MGQLFIPGEKQVKGPWFIGISELEELEDIVEFAFMKIQDSALKEFEDAKIRDSKSENIDMSSTISKEKEKLSKKTNKKVVLISKDGTRLIDSTIKGILKDSKLKDFKPMKLNIHTECGFTNKFTLYIQRSNYGELAYDVNCYDLDCKEEIIYKIDSWIERKKPNKAKKIWYSASVLFGIVSFAIAIFSALLIVTTDLPDFKSQYKDEINKIIKSGITKENETKSIELLLKYSTDYVPENIKAVSQVNKIPIQIFSISIIILLLSIFCPTTIIGIGRHKSLLKIYRIYTTIVLITLPAIFIIPPIIEWVKNLIGL